MGSIPRQLAAGLFIEWLKAAPPFWGDRLRSGHTVGHNHWYDLYSEMFLFGGLASTITLDVTGNWWGTTDVAAISTKIYDNAENSAAPVVVFEPLQASAW